MPHGEKRYHFLAITPPARLSAEARAFQEDLARRFGAHAALRNPPHFTLVPPFEATHLEASTIAAKLAEIIQGTEQFCVDVTGFGAFPPRVIFLEAEATSELVDLVRKLRHEVDSLVPGRLKPDARPFHPHLTLAYRDLTPEAFRSAWCEYREKNLEAEFIARSVTLFRHENGAWHVLRELPLKPPTSRPPAERPPA